MSGTDAIVIGGGCAGAASAYMLSRSGLTVRLIEANGIASGCSNHGTGISRLNLRDTDNPSHAALSRSHIPMLARMAALLEDETGMDLNYQVMPGMNVPLTLDAWEHMKAIGPAAGHVPLSVDAARELEPGLNPEIPGVLWEPYRPRIAGPRLTHAYAKAAENRGVDLVLGEKVVGIERRDDRVVGVRTTKRTYDADVVVLAMGVGAAEAGGWLGLDIPVRPIKGEALRLSYDGPRAKHALSPEGFRPGFVEQGHVIFRMDGVVSVGSTMEDTGYASEPSTDARERILRMAAYIWPALKDAKVKKQVYGLRPVPADGLPILGPVPGVSGAYIVTGHAAVAHSALYATITRDYVVNGSTDIVPDMAPFLLSRFSEGRWDGKVYGLARETVEADRFFKRAVH